VLAYLNRVSTDKPALFHQMESFVIEAAADPDVEARQLAFATLQRLKHPLLRRLALEQLSSLIPKEWSDAGLSASEPNQPCPPCSATCVH